MKRNEMIAHCLARQDSWDMVIVGGGATGVGVAVDAASRGYDVVTPAGHRDFPTSPAGGSRSTPGRSSARRRFCDATILGDKSASAFVKSRALI